MENILQAAVEKSRGEKLAGEIGVSSEHAQNMEKIMKYMEDHRLPELFNEILTRILIKQPDNAKQHIIEYLKLVRKVPSTDPHSQKVYQFMMDGDETTNSYLNQEDFESVFDSYDVLGIQSVPISYLAQALTVVGVENA